jgi:hypothetical protein
MPVTVLDEKKVEWYAMMWWTADSVPSPERLAALSLAELLA